MDKDKVQRFFDERTARAQDGHQLPVSGSASRALTRKYEKENDGKKVNLSKRKLNKDETKYAEKSGGLSPIGNARLLMNALRAQACPLTDVEVDILKELMGMIKAAISNYKAAV
jgi:hypothetical protein